MSVKCCLSCDYYTHLKGTCAITDELTLTHWGEDCDDYHECFHLCSTCKYFKLVPAGGNRKKWWCDMRKTVITKTYWCCEEYKEA